MDLNRATIVGRLTRDPEARSTPSGTNVTSFSVATNFVWTDPQGAKKEAVEYHNIVADNLIMLDSKGQAGAASARPQAAEEQIDVAAEGAKQSAPEGVPGSNTE